MSRMEASEAAIRVVLQEKDAQLATLKAENAALRERYEQAYIAQENELTRLRSALAEREKEVERVNVFREDLRSKFWEKDREIGQLRDRIASLEKLCGEAAEYLPKLMVGRTNYENDLLARLKIAAQPGSEKEDRK
jgi:septal ring factor EnvC (AmiA/AmiB activator)